MRLHSSARRIQSAAHVSVSLMRVVMRSPPARSGAHPGSAWAGSWLGPLGEHTEELTVVVDFDLDVPAVAVPLDLESTAGGGDHSEEASHVDHGLVETRTLVV